MNVTEELIEFEDRLDRVHVERRVEDRKARITDLYGRIETWLPSGWRARLGDDVPMHEELMGKFGIPEQRLSVLILQHGTALRARVEPRGLWIIGANGRVDLTAPRGHSLIVDRSENFEAPDWTIASLEKRRQRRAFDQRALVDALS